MDTPLFVLVDGRLGCFQFGATMNKAAMDSWVQICVDACLHFLFLTLHFSQYGPTRSTPT